MPSVATTVSTLFAAAQLVAGAAYTLTDNYNQANFFDSFEFFSEADPTKGFVQYQDRVNAASKGLAGFHQDMIYVGSDHKTANPANGRASTRLNSKKSYTQMLLVADVVHMPVVSYPTLFHGQFSPSHPRKGIRNKQILTHGPIGMRHLARSVDIQRSLAIQWRDRHHRGRQQPEVQPGDSSHRPHMLHDPGRHRRWHGVD